MSSNKAGLSSFDPSGEWFANVTADNRLKVWNTKLNGGSLKAEFATPSHLTEHITSLSWGSMPLEDIQAITSNLDSGKKRKRPKDQEASKMIALGYRNGEIIIFSISYGKEVFNLRGSVTKNVNDFVFSKDGSTGYSCSGEYILEWDIKQSKETNKWQAEKKYVNSLALSADGKSLLSAGNSIKLWDLETKKNTQKWIGHTSPVRQLVYTPQGLNFVSMAHEDRFLNIWNSFHGENSGAIAALALETVPLSLDLTTSSVGDKSKVFDVLSLSEEGYINLWQNPVKSDSQEGKKKTKSLKSEAKLWFVDDKDALIPVLAAKFVSDSKILVAYGSNIKPVFEPIVYLDEHNSLIKETKLHREITKGALLHAPTEKQEKKRTSEGVSVAAPESMGLAPKMDSSLIEGLQGPTLEEKVKDMMIVEEKVVTNKNVPKAGSLQQMLAQALQTHDNNLLEQCLAVRDNTVIQKTVERLPPPFVVPLLTQIIDRFQKNPRRGGALAIWIKFTLTFHAAYLMTVPNLVQKLGGLYQTVDSRLAVFKRLLKLSGRLDMIMSQVSLKTSSNESKESEPMTIFVDEEEVSDEDTMGFGYDDSDEQPKGKKSKKLKKGGKKEEDEEIEFGSEDGEEENSEVEGEDEEEEEEEEGDEEDGEQEDGEQEDGEQEDREGEGNEDGDVDEDDEENERQQNGADSEDFESDDSDQ